MGFYLDQNEDTTIEGWEDEFNYELLHKIMLTLLRVSGKRRLAKVRMQLALCERWREFADKDAGNHKSGSMSLGLNPKRKMAVGKALDVMPSIAEVDEEDSKLAPALNDAMG